MPVESPLMMKADIAVKYIPELTVDDSMGR
jgi:hypothetical protein